jgi:hypothetical protein
MFRICSGRGVEQGAMRDDEFERDDRKAARNARDHGITFEQARWPSTIRAASMRTTPIRTRGASRASAGSVTEFL